MPGPHHPPAQPTCSGVLLAYSNSKVQYSMARMVLASRSANFSPMQFLEWGSKQRMWEAAWGSGQAVASQCHAAMQASRSTSPGF